MTPLVLVTTYEIIVIQPPVLARVVSYILEVFDHLAPLSSYHFYDFCDKEGLGKSFFL